MLPQRPPAYEYARIRASHTLHQCAERSFFVVGATSHDPWRCPGRLVGASGAISVSAKIRPRGPVRPLWSHVRLRTNPAPLISAPSTSLYAPLGFGTLQGPRLRERPGGEINATAEERWQWWRALHYAGNPPRSEMALHRRGIDDLGRRRRVISKSLRAHEAPCAVVCLRVRALRRRRAHEAPCAVVRVRVRAMRRRPRREPAPVRPEHS